jgi:hypothetical protein
MPLSRHLPEPSAVCGYWRMGVWSNLLISKTGTSSPCQAPVREPERRPPPGRAGVVQVAVPMFSDQFYWGRRIRDLGIGLPNGRSGDLPVPAQGASADARVSDHAGSSERSRQRTRRCCLPPFARRRHPGRTLSRLYGWPMHSPVNASPWPSRTTGHDSGADVDRYSFIARDLHLYSLPVSRRFVNLVRCTPDIGRPLPATTRSKYDPSPPKSARRLLSFRSTSRARRACVAARKTRCFPHDRPLPACAVGLRGASTVAARCSSSQPMKGVRYGKE